MSLGGHHNKEMLCLAALLLLALAGAPLQAESSSSSSQCPYDLATAAQMIPGECYANATGGQAATGCCWYVFAAYIFAAADHANRTGEAFLPPVPSAACSEAFAATLLSGGLVSRSLLAGTNGGSCDLTAGGPGGNSKLAAGSRPCQLATVDAVRAQAPRALPNATRLCATASGKVTIAPDGPGCLACREAVIATTYEMLGAARTKEFVPCGMAATVAIWSRAPPRLDRFRAYALCMLQVLENVNSLGTSDLVPSPPPSPIEAPPPKPVASSRSSSSRRNDTIPIAAGTAGAVVFCTALIAAVVITTRRIRHQRNHNGDSEMSIAGDGNDDSDSSVATLPPLPREGVYIFTKAELTQATNGYDKKLLLGTGGSGKVYLGRLPSGQRVAIKRIYRSRKVSEFYAEVSVLAKLSHRNLAALLGYCLTDQHHALVYEYMPGGNLSQALSSQNVLTWRRRLEVAVDVAEGLPYLHALRVVHRDVKPTNVLLSASGAAKLSDFGVSRVILPDGSTHVSTEVRGTRGYVDPESFSAGHVSEAADVYSFGVVLLELATGKRAVVPTPSGGAESIVHAAHWAVAEAGGQEGAAAEAMADGRLTGPAAWDRPTVRAVFALARRCVRPYKNERPEISEVLAVLKAALTDYHALSSSVGDESLSSLPDEDEDDAKTSASSSSSAANTVGPASLQSTSSSAVNTDEVVSTLVVP